MRRTNVSSFVCATSLILLYINILGLVFMSKSLISSSAQDPPPSTSLLSQYYELRARLAHSANYSCAFEQSQVILAHFTLTYSEFVFVLLVLLVSGVYTIVRGIQFVSRGIRELGILNFR